MKTYFGTIVRRRHNDPRLTVLPEERILAHSGLDEQWWADAMECYCDTRNIWDSLADEKIPDEHKFGEHFAGPKNHLKQKLNIIPELGKTKRGFIISARRSSQPSLWDVHKKREESKKKDILVEVCETNQCERNYRREKKETNSLSHAQMAFFKLAGKDSEVRTSNKKGKDSQKEDHRSDHPGKENDRSDLTEQQQDAKETNNDLESISGFFITDVMFNNDKNSMCSRKPISLSTAIR